MRIIDSHLRKIVVYEFLIILKYNYNCIDSYLLPTHVPLFH